MFDIEVVTITFHGIIECLTKFEYFVSPSVWLEIFR